MRRAVALLATALLLAGLAGCGGGGAEPGAPEGASLVLDFTPNAVHTGIYAAQAEGFYEAEGVDLQIHEPGESTDAPKLLAAGRTDFAILDIHDLGVAREKGLEVVGVLPIVQVPLAAVIAPDASGVGSPKDLEGKTVGVTGLPSDEAVLDSEVSADGGDPTKVHQVTIGFNAVASLAAGNVDAATAFWNAEGVALESQGVPVEIFTVDEYGAPPYPELVLTVSRKTLEEKPELVEAVQRATVRGYEFTMEHSSKALGDLLAAVPALDPVEQGGQLTVLMHSGLQPAPFDPRVLHEWAAWDFKYGLLSRPLSREEFDQSFVDENLRPLGQ